MVELFILHPNVYPGFTGKLSTFAHFPLEPGGGKYTFLNQAVEDFE